VILPPCLWPMQLDFDLTFTSENSTAADQRPRCQMSWMSMVAITVRPAGGLQWSMLQL
jgi:hypothetical protein